ncbi:MAG: DUF4199 domain-containing protein [Firmicutes bacterium]|nr:DUF4199 domain-containing protein [Bacillota bacterium]
MLEKNRIEVKWGLIFTLAMLLWMLIERVSGLHSTHIDYHPMLTNLFAIIAITIYVLALRDKRERDFDGKMNWAQGFITGIYVTMVIAILSPFAQVLIHFAITPNFFTNAATHAVDAGHMSVEDAAAYFNFRSYVVQAFLGAILLGIVTSAVVATFVRRK